MNDKTRACSAANEVLLFENVYDKEISDLKYFPIEEVAQIVEFGKDEYHKALTREIQTKKTFNALYSTAEYKRDKKLLPAACIHAKLKKNGKDLIPYDFTGYLFLDFDDLDNEQLRDLQFILKDLLFVQFFYESLSRTGIHAWIRVNGITNIEDYYAVYRQLSAYFFNNFNFKLCQGSNIASQLILLPFNPKIVKRDYVEPYLYEFNKIVDEDYYRIFNKTKSGKPSELISIKGDDALYEHYYQQFILNKYNVSLTLFDIETNLPVEWSKDLKYDPAKHYFSKYASINAIGKTPKHNSTNTVAIFDKHIASFQLYISGKRKIKDGIRKKTLIGLMSAWAFVQEYNNKQVKQEHIVNLGLVLNQLCFDKEGINPLPLNDYHLKFVISAVWANITSGSISPKLIKRRSTHNQELMKHHKKNESESYLSVLLREIRALKTGHTWEDRISLTNEYIDKKSISIENKRDYLKAMSECTGLRESYLKRWFFQKGASKRQDQDIYCTSSLILPNLSPRCTFSIVQSCINEMITHKQLIKQKEIITLLAEKVSPRTIKTHWRRFKEQVKLHNDQIKKDNSITNRNGVKLLRFIAFNDKVTLKQRASFRIEPELDLEGECYLMKYYLREAG